MYAIMNRELNAYSHGPQWESDIFDDYKRLKKSILDPEHWLYGSKLVQLKTVKAGIQVKLEISWRRWVWTPQLSWRFGYYFRWLFLSMWLDYRYINVVDKVLKDHCRGKG